jgi:F-type H+-transporting ATPase subunit gamma
VGAVVFGTDQGLCGQFSEQIVTHAADWADEQAGGREQCAFVAMGVRTSGRLQDAGLSIDQAFPVPGSASGISPLVQDLLTTIERWQRERKLSRIVLLYNRRMSASSSGPHRRQLLPVDPQLFERLRQRRWPSRALPAFTMDRQRLLSSLVRQYLFVSLFRACAESLAAENASRINSMQAAERNIEDRLGELRLGYNQQRQTSITAELLDVVTGFEALTQHERC